MKKIFRKIFYCTHCGTKMIGTCNSPIYAALTGKASAYMYKVRCPNKTQFDHVDGYMYPNGKLAGR